MKKFSPIVLALLVGCGTPSPAPKKPPGPPPLPVVTSKKRPAALQSARAQAQGVPNVAELTRDVFVVNCPIDFAYWNGSSYNLPIDTSWMQIFITNSQHAPFVQLDYSEDLSAWVNLGYFTNYTNGIWIVDPTAVGLQRFYRLGAVQ